MAESPQKQSLRVQYEELSAKFASQFVVNVGEDELILNFSSGIISEPNSNQGYLPIHTRIALSPLGARKLHALLGQIIAQRPGQPAQIDQGTAKLPSLPAQDTTDPKSAEGTGKKK